MLVTRAARARDNAPQPIIAIEANPARAERLPPAHLRRLPALLSPGRTNLLRVERLRESANQISKWSSRDCSDHADRVLDLHFGRNEMLEEYCTKRKFGSIVIM